MRRKQSQQNQHPPAAADGTVYDHPEQPSFTGGSLLGQPAATLRSESPAYTANHRGTAASFPGAGGQQILAEVEGRLRESQKAKKGGFKDWKRR